jgi:hypothetical protein
VFIEQDIQFILTNYSPVNGAKVHTGIFREEIDIDKYPI